MAELTERLGAGNAAAAGIAPTLRALGEWRVQRLVLDAGFAAQGERCPECAFLAAGGEGTCPVDGSGLAPVGDLRAAAVECAVLQDADVTVVGEGGALPPAPLVTGEAIAALLRF